MAQRSPLFSTVALLTGFAILAGTTAARSELRNEATVTEGIIAVGIAYEISEVCDDLDARLFRGIAYLNSLKSEARSLGYTDAEIDAFTDSDAEQDRLEAIARDRLANMGATPGDEASHCAVGRAEIAAETAIGRLLR